MGEAHGELSGPDGPTAVIMAGKGTDLKKRVAVSSLHFEPVPEVQWRTVFQIKPKSDVEISFPIEV